MGLLGLAAVEGDCPDYLPAAAAEGLRSSRFIRPWPFCPRLARTFPSPEAAVQAAIEAAASGTTALLALLGPDGKDIVTSGDAVQDQKDRDEFVRLAREKTRIAKDPANPGRATVMVGNAEFPNAIPLVQKNGVWMWDAVEGLYELLIRRIGENELDTIAVCRGYVEAQVAYAALDPDKTGVHQYAQRVISTPGKHDGLSCIGAPSLAARRAPSAKTSPARSRKATPARRSRIAATATRS